MKLFILCLCFTSSFCGFIRTVKIPIYEEPCLEENYVPTFRKSAELVVWYTKWIREQMDLYKDNFIRKLDGHHADFQEYIQFNEAQNEQWLRSFNWYIDEILPKEKILNQPLSDKYIEEIKAIENDFDCVMEKIIAASQYILGTFYVITVQRTTRDFNGDKDLKRSVNETMRIIRSIICAMQNYSRDLSLPSIVEDYFFLNTVPFNKMGVVLKDTLNYFEYINQVFKTLQNRNETNYNTCFINKRSFFLNGE